MCKQVFIGSIMQSVGKRIDPESVEALNAMALELSGSELIAILTAFFLVAITPVIAVLLWFLRRNFEPPMRSKVLKIAGGMVALSAVGLAYLIFNSGSDSQEMEIINKWIGLSPIMYLLILLSFPPMAIGLWLGVKHLQNRPILSLHTAAKRFRWRRLLFSMGVFWTIAIILSAFGHLSGLSKAEFVFDASRFWAYLPITPLFIPMQSATEEIALREIHEVCHNDVPLVPLWQTVGHYAFRNDLTGLPEEAAGFYQTIDAWRMTDTGGRR